jgi:hypothetical protein
MIVSIGEPMVEFNQTRAGEGTYLQGFGGDSSNMIIAAARTGACTAYFTRVGDDEFGRMLLELWKREGVDTSGVIVDREAPTGAYFVTHGPTGHVFPIWEMLPLCMPRGSAWRSRNRRATPFLQPLKEQKERSRSTPTCASSSGRSPARGR